MPSGHALAPALADRGRTPALADRGLSPAPCAADPDPGFFAGRDAFTEQMDYICERCRTNRPIRRGQPVRVPGDQAARGVAAAPSRGIAYEAATWTTLGKLAAKLGVTLPSGEPAVA